MIASAGEFDNLDERECRDLLRFLEWHRDNLLPKLGPEQRAERADIDRRIAALRDRLPQQFLFPVELSGGWSAAPQGAHL